MLKKILMSSLILVAACGNSNDPGNGIRSPGPQNTCAKRSSYDFGGPVSLVNQDGKAVTEADFKGEYSLVFFGFTNCPDVCPFTLNRIYNVLDMLPENVTRPKTVLISVDPEMDTPESMKTYIGNQGFPDNIVGLTGTPEQIKNAADAFKASYSRQEDPGSAAGYTVEHSALIYLMDDKWKYKTFFSPQETPDSMAACLSTYLPKS